MKYIWHIFSSNPSKIASVSFIGTENTWAGTSSSATIDMPCNKILQSDLRNSRSHVFLARGYLLACHSDYFARQSNIFATLWNTNPRDKKLLFRQKKKVVWRVSWQSMYLWSTEKCAVLGPIINIVLSVPKVCWHILLC